VAGLYPSTLGRETKPTTLPQTFCLIKGIRLRKEREREKKLKIGKRRIEYREKKKKRIG